MIMDIIKLFKEAIQQSEMIREICKTSTHSWQLIKRDLMNTYIMH